MIVKKVKNAQKSSSKAVRITRLAAYIREPDNVRQQEKCIHAGARNFITDTPAGQAAEMIALAQESVRSKDPIVHYVLSWPDGEQPGPAQVEAAVDIYLEELDVPAHQVVYGLHADTDNIHLHIMLNRVHPDTRKCIDIGGGFDIEAAHRAIARIEHAQGWRPEQNARYRVRDDGRAERQRAGPAEENQPGQTGPDHNEMEQLTGEDSALRITTRDGAPIFRRAETWSQLHRELADVGLRYEKAGSGARMFVGKTFIKASQIDRQASLSKLQARLGPYEPASAPAAPVTSNKPAAVRRERPKQPSQRQADMEHRTGEKSAVRIAIESGAPILRRAETWSQLHRDLAGVSMRYEKSGSGATLFVGDTGVKASSVDRQASLSKLQKRLGPYEPPAQPIRVTPRNAEPIKPMAREWDDYIAGRKAHYAAKAAARLALDQRLADERITLSREQRAQRAELLSGRWRNLGDVLNALRSVKAAEQAAEKADLKEKHRAARAQHRQRFRPYPDFNIWQRLAPGQPHPPIIAGDRDEPPTARDIRAFRPAIRGREVYYTRREIPAGPHQPASFVDQGKRIQVHEWRQEDATLAALQLSSQKWDRFTVNGNDEYKAMCARLAAEHGFKVTNPELQDTIEQLRQARQQAGSRVPGGAAKTGGGP